MRYLLASTLALAAVAHADEAPGWQSFTWMPFQAEPYFTDKAAILIDVKVDGVDCKMKLDAGAGDTTIFRRTAEHWLQRKIPGDEAEFKLDIGDRSLKLKARMESVIGTARDKQCGVIGTLGNDLFAKGTLTLDLLQGRWRFEPKATLKGQGQPFDWRKQGRGGQIVMTLQGPDNQPLKMMFDTGMGPMGLAVDRKLWPTATGVDRPDLVFAFPTLFWGRQQHCYQAPSSMSASLAGVTLNKAPVLYCDKSSDMWWFQDGHRGAMGLAGINDTVLALDFLSRRFTLTRPAKPAVPDVSTKPAAEPAAGASEPKVAPAK
ncbi:hypothetical protein [Chitinimonas lacunae]|uniref:Aspartyl protease n=1 Tax=Chitinimonas lacunae TaxID=1963018 RepID=A0ABV8MPS7_9NEIS